LDDNLNWIKKGERWREFFTGHLKQRVKREGESSSPEEEEGEHRGRLVAGGELEFAGGEEETLERREPEHR
jgi:hypothetical protein